MPVITDVNKVKPKKGAKNVENGLSSIQTIALSRHLLNPQIWALFNGRINTQLFETIKL
jgi:hypothetical protein